ncbi:uncharacterized protein LOC121762224 isoform X2 [Salvia splendens]|uniref:uncharacterized protein LOC121762224 isoform X2 n=1 Tax=Salvia splendens TaxID=180675 RepID=UPI001C269880|nr:uncharacterized protein LOC121762224 isoform X2 [Salvia splendens]XP_042013974.1 uncharacterized protein LOC121762224 isoform X2 [Salvia splendens]
MPQIPNPFSGCWMISLRRKTLHLKEPMQRKFYWEEILGPAGRLFSWPLNKCLLDYIPQRDSTQNVSDKLVVDGADGVGGEKLDNLKTRKRRWLLAILALLMLA